MVGVIYITVTGHDGTDFQNIYLRNKIYLLSFSFVYFSFLNSQLRENKNAQTCSRSAETKALRLRRLGNLLTWIIKFHPVISLLVTKLFHKSPYLESTTESTNERVTS